MSFWGLPAGMQVFTGRLRKEEDKIGFTLLVNNLVKGAAGGSIANAEFFISREEREGREEKKRRKLQTKSGSIKAGIKQANGNDSNGVV